MLAKKIVGEAQGLFYYYGCAVALPAKLSGGRERERERKRGLVDKTRVYMDIKEQERNRDEMTKL